MNALGVKKQIVRGGGSGKEAVMGRLKNLSQLRRREDIGAANGFCGWESFSRAVGIAVSRIGELKECLRNMMPTDIELLLEAMLALLRSRDFLAEARDMIDSGIPPVAAVEHIAAEYEADRGVSEISLLLIGILQGDRTEYFSEEGMVIALSRNRIDATEILAIVRAEISGLVCVGDRSCLAGRVAGLFGLPALFVSLEDAETINSGERAILSPARGTLVIDPDIEEIDDFLSRSRECESDETSNSFFGERIYRVLDLEMRQSRGLLVDVGRSDKAENELFMVYRRMAERVGRGYCIAVVREGEDMYEHLRALTRAAVYGRILVAASSNSADGFCRIRDTLALVCEELSREGREFEESVGIGAAIDNARGVLLADRIAESADFLLIDFERLVGEQSGAEGEAATEALLRLVLGINLNRKKKLILLGDMRLLKEKTEEMFSSQALGLSVCFLSGR